ncbi:LCP family protein [Kitasatospora sp. YST-16]|uniref:LCP family protein n=1 Tax=Kitasatospora sp. YST-16 TaxID=2998080 RepID=UPI0022838A88|nr:LCP family protein [Kitasatospora sp. YST-16]WAL73195.1 LCP family protein [Kitasatospora sp. YST-16]WNW39248.1 LCP family protein [Streptomyces sp. Li-HN-5-13]
MDGGASGANGDGEGEFEVQLGAAFGLTGSGPGPEVTARLVDGGLAAGRRRTRARRRRTVLLAGALTAAVAVGAGLLTAPRDVPGERTPVVELAHSGPDPAPPPLADGVTVLLVGTDSSVDARGEQAPDGLRHGDLHSGGANQLDATDTVMLVHVPAGGGEVRQLSLPRDVLVRDGNGHEVPLGHVYLDAETAEIQRLDAQGLPAPELRERGREAGRRALFQAVEMLTLVRVNHYAELSMTGFYRTAQALGGIPVCLNHAVDDPASGARLPAGRQELGPAQALAFVRQRHGVGDGSDLGRTRRAQAFLAGVVEKLRGGGVLADPGKLGALYRAMADELVVDQDWSPVDFVRQVPALAAGRGTLTTLPVTREGTRLRAVEGAARRILADGAEPSGSASPAASGPGATAPAADPGPEPVELGGAPCVD